MPIVKSPGTHARRLLLILVLLGIVIAAPGALASTTTRSSANTGIGATPTSADLKFELTVAVDPLPPQNIILIGIVNRGPDVAQNAIFRFPIPEGARFRNLTADRQITATFPPRSGTGEIVCLLGDLPSNQAVTIFIVVEYFVPPGTKIMVQASLFSDTPDTNLDNNVLSYEFPIAPLPRIISVRALSNPFRIEITGQNLFVPKFTGSGIGIGCDCHNWPVELVHSEGGNVILSGGRELKRQFPSGVPIQICYSDEVGGTIIKTTFTRESQ
jgi:Domain of unknown function DUF11